MNTVQETVENLTEVWFNQITFTDQIIYNLGIVHFRCFFHYQCLKNNCLDMNLNSVLGWFLLFSMDHVCLLKVSHPLTAHHYSLKKADQWFHLAQLQVISCSLVCLLNVSGVLLRMSRTHFKALSSLTFIRINGPTACCVYGEGK